MKTISIHLYDIVLIPKVYKKNKNIKWNVFYVDELKSYNLQEKVELQLENKNVKVYSNQDWQSVWATHTVNQLQYSVKVNPDPSCHFTIMNRKPRNHRVDIMNQLNDVDLLSKNYYSWTDTRVGDLPYNSNHCTFPAASLDSNMEHENDMWSVPSVAFGDSAASVVIESNENELFITEKTFIPLYQQRMPLVYGAPGLYEKLKEYKFEFPKQLRSFLNKLDTDAPTTVRRNQFVQMLESLSQEYSPRELVEMYDTYAVKNKKTLIKLAQDFPNIYSKWKKTIPRWAQTANVFIQQIERSPKIGL
jgi:hypothetical protein